MVEETSDAILAKKLFQNVASMLFSLRYYSTYRYKSWKRVITPLYGVPKNLGQFSRLFFAALLPPPHYRSMSHQKAAKFSLPIFSVRILMLKYAMLSLMLLIIIYTNHILFMHSCIILSVTVKVFLPHFETFFVFAPTCENVHQLK